MPRTLSEQQAQPKIHKFEMPTASEMRKSIKDGVEMIDILDYALPFGFAGRFFHPIIIKPKLNEIFNYRRNKLIEIFGNF